MSTSYADWSKAIYLYTIPLRGDRVNAVLKIGFFSHWALCIQGLCYELRKGNKKKGEPKFLYVRSSEQDWREARDYDNPEGPKRVGSMTETYHPDVVDEVGE